MNMDAKKLEQIITYKGLISAPFTGFKPNGEINPEILPNYVDFLVKNGVKGVFVNGTTGEGLSLTVEERKIVAEGWVKAGKNKLDLIIIQVGANSVRDAQELARHAEKIGVTGIASLPPLFYKPPTDEILIEYFKDISNAAPSLPIMLYHIPDFSSVPIVVSRLLPKARASIPNFCGAKFTSVDVRDLLRSHSLPGPPFKLLSGYDEVMLPALSCGVTAFIGSSYNYMASSGLRVIDAYNKGNIDEARKTAKEILLAVDRINSHGQPIACQKALMSLITPLDLGPVRTPMVPLTPKALANLKEDVKVLNADLWSKK